MTARLAWRRRRRTARPACAGGWGTGPVLAAPGAPARPPSGGSAGASPAPERTLRARRSSTSRRTGPTRRWPVRRGSGDAHPFQASVEQEAPAQPSGRDAGGRTERRTVPQPSSRIPSLGEDRARPGARRRHRLDPRRRHGLAATRRGSRTAMERRLCTLPQVEIGDAEADVETAEERMADESWLSLAALGVFDRAEQRPLEMRPGLRVECTSGGTEVRPERHRGYAPRSTSVPVTTTAPLIPTPTSSHGLSRRSSRQGNPASGDPRTPPTTTCGRPRPRRQRRTRWPRRSPAPLPPHARHR